ncbi:hypothetical protein HMPREF3156_00796 [Neisseria sp. HMSC06F02]|nr:hypothetical protein [Neisseria sicca]KJJ19259.1 hypothetical protein HMPREF3156_00796 [Neisseria sp. HMSC06F02]
MYSKFTLNRRSITLFCLDLKKIRYKTSLPATASFSDDLIPISSKKR